MPNGMIDPLQIRGWVYEGLRQSTTSSHAPKLDGIALYVRSKAIAASIVERRPFEGNYDIPIFIADAVRGIVWELIIQGVIVPGTGLGGGSGEAGLPFFQITEWGKRSLVAGEFAPYDTFQFIDRLKSKVPGVDQSVLLYVTEALNSFRAGTYLGSAVMLGVASEAVLLALRAAIESAVSDQSRKEKFIANTVGKPIRRVYDQILSRLDPNMEQIAAALHEEDISAELFGIFSLIRKTRNDAGHPTGRSVEREEAFALLQLFPSYCGVAYKLIDWLKNQSI